MAAIGRTLNSDLLLRIESRRDRTAVVVGAHSLAHALRRVEHLFEQYYKPSSRQFGSWTGQAAARRHRTARDYSRGAHASLNTIALPMP